MKVLLSIKPEFALKIFEGTKKYEFRKTIFKQRDVKTVVVYASSPIQRIIGEFLIEEILNEEVNLLWELTNKEAGIDEKRFREYFAEKERAFAIKIKSVFRYDEPKTLSDYSFNYAPQSYAYIE